MLGDASIELPAAPPHDYLQWVAHWRERQGNGPSATDEVAGFISSALIAPIDEQAAAAATSGAPSVAPSVSGRPRMLIDAGAYLRRRELWLGSIADAGLTPALPSELIALRDEVIEAIQEQAWRSAMRDAM